MIKRSSIVVCLIGKETASRDWVEWELRTAIRLHKGMCGVYCKGNYAIPEPLKDIGAPISNWNEKNIMSAIECAAAKRC